MPIKVFIPSYKRETTIKSHRLFLNQELFDLKIVVNEPEDKKLYLENNLDLKESQVICSRARGIAAQRAFIQEQVEEGEWYISADDDHESIMYVDDIVSQMSEVSEAFCKKEYYQKILTDKELFHILSQMIELCESKKCELFGVATNDNPFFRKKKITENGFIIGQLFGEKKNSKIPIDTSIKIKEDYERTAKHLLYNGITIRNNFLRPVTKMYSEGGVGNLKERTPELKRACGMLMENYPGLFRVNNARSNEGEIVIRLHESNQVRLWRLSMIVRGKLSQSKVYEILPKAKADEFLSRLINKTNN